MSATVLLREVNYVKCSCSIQTSWVILASSLPDRQMLLLIKFSSGRNRCNFIIFLEQMPIILFSQMEASSYRYERKDVWLKGTVELRGIHYPSSVASFDSLNEVIRIWVGAFRANIDTGEMSTKKVSISMNRISSRRRGEEWIWPISSLFPYNWEFWGLFFILS